MLETLTRLMFPMPAASSALSKALRSVPPSARPAVAAAIVTRFVIRSSSPLGSRLQSPCRHQGGEKSLATLPTRRTNAREKCAPTPPHDADGASRRRRHRVAPPATLPRAAADG